MNSLHLSWVHSVKKLRLIYRYQLMTLSDVIKKHPFAA